ncbi:DIS3-like exonuclease 2 [Lucilia cuprina]|nr:DIS3-like exonuclease 2 [Lucilia cuprina]
MARARYYCSEGKSFGCCFWHYALSIPIYTHFTSPIRRYLISLYIVLCIALTLARPQRFPVQQFPNQGFIGGGNNIFFPSNPNNNFNNNASPQFLACMQSCPSTMEYNPVCGSDMENYHNNGRLGCAQRCGKNVAALRMGTCNPL